MLWKDESDAISYRGSRWNGKTSMKLPDIKKLLSSHTGFAASKEWLQEIADSHEVLINYFPKFHCELNFIEMV